VRSLATDLGAAKVGEAAPEFSAAASNAKNLSTSDFTESMWSSSGTNNGCPYVGKQYKSGTCRGCQKQWTGQGVRLVYDPVFRSGQAGFRTASEENDYMAKMQAAPTAHYSTRPVEIGPSFTTRDISEMVVINPQGVVIYDGAIDDKPTTDLSGRSWRDELSQSALEQAMAASRWRRPRRGPYGCSVKYRDSRITLERLRPGLGLDECLVLLDAEPQERLTLPEPLITGRGWLKVGRALRPSWAWP